MNRRSAARREVVKDLESLSRVPFVRSSAYSSLDLLPVPAARSIYFRPWQLSFDLHVPYPLIFPLIGSGLLSRALISLGVSASPSAGLPREIRRILSRTDRLLTIPLDDWRQT